MRSTTLTFRWISNRVTLSGFLWSLALMAGVVAAHGEEVAERQTIFLECDDTAMIEIAACRVLEDGAQVTGDRKLLLRLDDGCLGRRDAEQCQAARLLEHATRLPLEDARMMVSWSEAGVRRSAAMEVTAGEATVPLWVDEVRFTADGYEDRTFRDGSGVPADEPLLFRQGRRVSMSCTVTDSVETDAVELSIAGDELADDVDFSVEKKIPVNERVSVGAIPLGHYLVSVSGDGIAPVGLRVAVGLGPEPMLLELMLEKGLCITIPVDVSEVEGIEELRYSLTQIKENQIPIDYGEGVAGLQPKGDTGMKEAKICGLSPARYQMDLGGKGTATVALSIEVPVTKGIPPVYLVAADARQLLVLDETNAPVQGAEVACVWGTGKKQAAVSRITNSEGVATLPAFAEDTALGVFVVAEGYQDASLLTSSLQDAVIILKPTGLLTAEIAPEDCKEAELHFDLSRPCNYREDCWDSVSAYYLDGCSIEEPISEEGEYRLTITSPIHERFRKVISVSDDLDQDLGTIRLEPGRPFEVTVTSNDGRVEGASVLLEERAPAVRTDSRGVAVFHSLENDIDEVVVRASHPEYAPSRSVVSVTEERSATVELHRPGTIHGLVLRADGSAAAGDRIMVIGNDLLKREVMIDHTGEYSIAGLGPGRWQISRWEIAATRTTIRQGTGDTKHVVLAEGERKRVDFTYPTRIYGEVTLNGQPLPGVNLKALPHGEAVSIGFASDESGHYEASLPHPGAWSVSYRGRKTSIEVMGPCPCLIDLEFETSEVQNQR